MLPLLLGTIRPAGQSLLRCSLCMSEVKAADAAMQKDGQGCTGPRLVAGRSSVDILQGGVHNVVCRSLRQSVLSADSSSGSSCCQALMHTTQTSKVECIGHAMQEAANQLAAWRSRNVQQAASCVCQPWSKAALNASWTPQVDGTLIPHISAHSCRTLLRNT